MFWRAQASASDVPGSTSPAGSTAVVSLSQAATWWFIFAPAQPHGRRQIRDILLVTVVLISIQPPQTVHQGHLATTDRCHQAEQADHHALAWATRRALHRVTSRGRISADIWIMVPILHQSSTCPTLLEINSSLLLLLCWKPVNAQENGSN